MGTLKCFPVASVGVVHAEQPVSANRGETTSTLPVAPTERARSKRDAEKDREETAAIIRVALRARRITNGQVARWWKCTPSLVQVRLSGERTIGVELIRALPLEVRKAVNRALEGEVPTAKATQQKEAA